MMRIDEHRGRCAAATDFFQNFAVRHLRKTATAVLRRRSHSQNADTSKTINYFARNVGVPVARTKITLFMMTSGVASLMGIIEALELRSMQAKEGIGLEFIFIICAVVGGCLLTGGFGSVIGTFFGAAMLGMVQLGIVDSQWDSNWTFTFQGGILFAAVMLNTLIRSRAQKAR